MNTIQTLTFSQRFGKHLHEKGESNEQLFKSLNLLLDYLGAKTISEYAQEKSMSVQNVYQNKVVKTILGRKVVFDND